MKRMNADAARTPKKTGKFSVVQYDSNICESEVLQYSTSFGTK